MGWMATHSMCMGYFEQVTTPRFVFCVPYALYGRGCVSAMVLRASATCPCNLTGCHNWGEGSSLHGRLLSIFLQSSFFTVTRLDIVVEIRWERGKHCDAHSDGGAQA